MIVPSKRDPATTSQTSCHPSAAPRFSVLNIAHLLGIQIPGVMFCDRKHLSLYSDGLISSLDMVGSLDGASLPGKDPMKELLKKCKQDIRKWHFLLPKTHGKEDFCYHYCFIIILYPVVIRKLPYTLSQCHRCLGCLLFIKEAEAHS